MRMNRKMGEDDPNLQRDLTAAGARFQGLLAEVDTNLAIQGEAWNSGDDATRETAAKSMLTLLDRRRYLRNLVRDVNEVLAV
jgi:molecular chaperone HscB